MFCIYLVSISKQDNLVSISYNIFNILNSNPDINHITLKLFQLQRNPLQAQGALPLRSASIQLLSCTWCVGKVPCPFLPPVGAPLNMVYHSIVKVSELLLHLSWLSESGFWRTEESFRRSFPMLHLQ